MSEQDVEPGSLEDITGAWRTAAAAADRFRDVLSEALGFDGNPGDDTLVTTLRERHGCTGPEPTRWRDLCGFALQVTGHSLPGDTEATP